MTDTEDYKSIADVSRMMKVSRETVRKWLLEGMFPNAVKPGRKYLIPTSDIQAVLEQTFGAVKDDDTDVVTNPEL